MANKSRKFEKKYIITFKGRSRGWENEPTFMEGIIDHFMNKIMVVAFRSNYKGTKIKIKETLDK